MALGKATCAVGERLNGDMVRYKAAPQHVILAGVEFTQAVEDDEVQDAQDAYDKIQTLLRGLTMTCEEKLVICVEALKPLTIIHSHTGECHALPTDYACICGANDARGRGLEALALAEQQP